MQCPNSQRLDSLAIALAMGCLAQCLLLPAVLSFLPLAGIAWSASEQVHRLLLCLAVPATTVALSTGCGQHRRSSVAWLGGVGLALFVAATLFERQWSTAVFQTVSLTGGGLLATAHIRNYRLCRRNACPEPH